MAKTILFAVALLLLGALAGNEVARYAAGRHQPARSVMRLAQFHFDRLSTIVKSGQCKDLPVQRERLVGIYSEILEAFPLAYAQDPEFRKRADGLRDILRSQQSDAAGCTSEGIKQIDDACEACHRDYR